MTRIRMAVAIAMFTALGLAPMAQAAGSETAAGDQMAKSAGDFYKTAKAHAKAGKLDLAMVDLDRAIALDPAMGAAYYDRALLHFKKGDVDRAIADYTKTIELLPTFPPAYRERGTALIAKREFKRAIADFDAAIKLKADYADAFDERGYAYRMLKDFDRAIADYGRALEINPKLTVTLFRRCWVRAVANRELDLALADCDAGLKANAKDKEGYESRCFVYFRKGDAAKALKDCEAALALDAKLPKTLYLRGLMKLRAGDRQGGDADIAAAKLSDPAVATKFADYGVTG
jgi:tetratricopeptide (TPR) repeat protein